MAKKPASRTHQSDQHAENRAGHSERGRTRRGERAGDIAEAASEAAEAGGGFLSRLPLVQMLKTAFLAYASYRGAGALGTFWNELKNGTPYDLRDKSKQATATDGAKAAVADAALDKNLSSLAGKSALEGGSKITEGLNGRSASDSALKSAANPGASSVESAPVALQEGMKGQVIRLALPGQGDRTVDFKIEKSVNDQSALAEFQAGYSKFAKEKGLPSELPAGSSLSIGAPSSGMFSTSDKTAREYRFLGGDQFERNRAMSGSLDGPQGAWRSDPGFKSSGYRFDIGAVASGSPDLVRAETIEAQAHTSRLITHEHAFAGASEPPVTTPVSVGNRLLGHSAGSDFEALGKAVGVGADASVVKSHDVVSGQSSVGIRGASGTLSIQSDSADRISSAQHKEGTSVFVALEAPKGSLGQFDRKGAFEGKEAATGAFEAVGKAANSAEKSPILVAANDAGVEGRKAVYSDLKPGTESLTTRIAYEGRVVDYQAKNGSIVMIERDPQTHQPKDAAIIRSQGIKLKDGQLELDAHSSKLVREHVDLASKGRSLEFAEKHPEVRQQFASLSESEGKSTVHVVGNPDRGAAKPIDGQSRAADLGVEPDRGGSSKIAAIKEAGLQELSAPVSAVTVPAARPKSSAMEIGG